MQTLVNQVLLFKRRVRVREGSTFHRSVSIILNLLLDNIYSLSKSLSIDTLTIIYEFFGTKPFFESYKIMPIQQSQ